MRVDARRRCRFIRLTALVAELCIDIERRVGGVFGVVLYGNFFGFRLAWRSLWHRLELLVSNSMAVPLTSTVTAFSSTSTCKPA
jgi:hypothetical protein